MLLCWQIGSSRRPTPRERGHADRLCCRPRLAGETTHAHARSLGEFGAAATPCPDRCSSFGRSLEYYWKREPWVVTAAIKTAGQAQGPAALGGLCATRKPNHRTFAELAINFYVFFLNIPDDGMFENAETSLVSQVADVLHSLQLALSYEKRRAGKPGSVRATSGIRLTQCHPNPGCAPMSALASLFIFERHCLWARACGYYGGPQLERAR